MLANGLLTAFIWNQSNQVSKTRGSGIARLGGESGVFNYSGSTRKNSDRVYFNINNILNNII